MQTTMDWPQNSLTWNKRHNCICVLYDWERLWHLIPAFVINEKHLDCDGTLLYTITVFFFGEGAPQLMLRTHRSLKAYCATPVMKMSSFLPSCTSNGAPVE
jgi:hypothetical protein